MKLLLFCPTQRLEPETLERIVCQKGVNYDLMLTKDNPFDCPSWNIRYAYNKMRDVVLSVGYSKVLIVESDIIPPFNTFETLLGIDADIASGIYPLRQSRACNLRVLNPATEQTVWNWSDVRDHWGEVVNVAGGCMGCLLIDRTVLERYEFEVKDGCAPDTPFMDWCVKNNIRQKADLSVVCGHKRPDGTVLWPDKRLQVVQVVP